MNRKPKSGMAPIRRAVAGVPLGDATGGSREPSAQERRKHPTRAEAVLWNELRRCGVDGWRFRRQALLFSWIVPFYCPAGRLVILLRENAAESRLSQMAATKLRGAGLKVLTVNATEVLKDVNAVRTQIANALV